VAGQVTLGTIAATTEADDANILGIDLDFAKSWYSHRRRGMRAKLQKTEPSHDSPHIDRSALDAERSASVRPRAGSLSTWAILIKRIYETDPLECPKCGGAMKILSFIERRQRDVIERILRHCNL
jgi:hypothetical protein